MVERARLESVYTLIAYRGFESLSLRQVNGGFFGSLATLDCEPRQARKGAAVVIDVCAGSRLRKLPPFFVSFLLP